MKQLTNCLIISPDLHAEKPEVRPSDKSQDIALAVLMSPPALLALRFRIKAQWPVAQGPHLVPQPPHPHPPSFPVHIAPDQLRTHPNA